MEGHRYLSRQSVETMTRVFTPDVKPSGWLGGTGYGLTFEIVNQPEGTLLLHSPGTFGHGGAFGTEGWIDPKNDLSASCWCNRLTAVAQLHGLLSCKWAKLQFWMGDDLRQTAGHSEMHTASREGEDTSYSRDPDEITNCEGTQRAWVDGKISYRSERPASRIL